MTASSVARGAQTEIREARIVILNKPFTHHKNHPINVLLK